MDARCLGRRQGDLSCARIEVAVQEFNLDTGVRLCHEQDDAMTASTRRVGFPPSGAHGVDEYRYNAGLAIASMVKREDAGSTGRSTKFSSEFARCKLRDEEKSGRAKELRRRGQGTRLGVVDGLNGSDGLWLATPSRGIPDLSPNPSLSTAHE